MRKLNFMLPPKLFADDPALFQEQLRRQCLWDDDLMWAMAACCTIQAKSSRPAAFPVMNNFLALFTPESTAAASHVTAIYLDLLEVLRPSGLFHVKATRLASLSQDWIEGRPYDKLAGASTYFQQSWEIFGLERFPHIDRIADTHLRAYVCARAKDSSSSRV